MKKVLILGLKKSGKALVEFLAKENKVYVYDEDKKTLNDFCDNYSLKYDFYVLDNLDKLDNVDFVVKSPGISNQNSFIKYLKAKGIKIENELDFASAFIKGELISVTGTNGKSTVVSLIYHILKVSNKMTLLAGNIGEPLTNYINASTNNCNVVVEASSFQLDEVFNHHPKIAVLLNIAPDHLIWHDGFENYIKAKMNIFKLQTKNDYAVLNFDDDNLKQLDLPSDKYFFSLNYKVKGVYLKNNFVYFSDGEIDEKVISLKKLSIEGRHILSNYLAAICVCKILKISNEKIISGIESFKPLEHRYETFLSKNGVSFINDSKATNIASTKSAIAASCKKSHLLLGGSDKGEDFDNLFDFKEIKNVKIAYIFGDTKEKLVQSAEKFGVEFVRCDNLYDATVKACKSAKKGEIVLLSPACASFDEFTSFEERGSFFKEAVIKLIYEKDSFS